jgi:protein-S-isoprenylcysteine O-methyltransferase Ste14
MFKKFKKLIFRYRSFLPIPLIISAMLLAKQSPLYSKDYIIFEEINDWIAIFIILFGEMIRIWAISHIGVNYRTSLVFKVRNLTTTGPYALTRNPMYLGNFIIGIGFCVLIKSFLFFLIYLIFFFIEYKTIISLEEEFLLNVFEDKYKQYCEKVPCFFPTFKPKLKVQIKGKYKFFKTKEYQTVLAIVLISILLELAEEIYFFKFFHIVF